MEWTRVCCIQILPTFVCPTRQVACHAAACTKELEDLKVLVPTAVGIKPGERIGVYAKMDVLLVVDGVGADFELVRALCSVSFDDIKRILNVSRVLCAVVGSSAR